MTQLPQPTTADIPAPGVPAPEPEPEPARGKMSVLRLQVVLDHSSEDTRAAIGWFGDPLPITPGNAEAVMIAAGLAALQQSIPGAVGMRPPSIAVDAPTWDVPTTPTEPPGAAEG